MQILNRLIKLYLQRPAAEETKSVLAVEEAKNPGANPKPRSQPMNPAVIARTDVFSRYSIKVRECVCECVHILSFIFAMLS